mgnify:CR=1 FL=1
MIALLCCLTIVNALSFCCWTTPSPCLVVIYIHSPLTPLLPPACRGQKCVTPCSANTYGAADCIYDTYVAVWPWPVWPWTQSLPVLPVLNNIFLPTSHLFFPFTVSVLSYQTNCSLNMFTQFYIGR